MSDYWGNVASGLLVFNKKNCKVLLQHRSPYVYEPNTWGMIGGAVSERKKHIDIGERFSDLGVDEEHILTSAIDEFVEETGYKGEVTSIRKYHVFKSPDGKFEYHSYLGFVDDEFEPEGNWEAQGYKWVDLEKLFQCAKKDSDCVFIGIGKLHPQFKKTLSIEETKKLLQGVCETGF